jgi:NAD(P)-dependent dehydrogenase (short-subunit alcohol dehydrogenase family)
MGTQLCYASNREQQDSNRDRIFAWNVNHHYSPTDLRGQLTATSGKAIALRLANDGYDVCINDVAANKPGCDEVVKEIEGLGRKAFAFTADVSNLQEVQELVKASASELGPLSTMVANAGIAQVKGLLELTEQDFKRMFEVNGKSSRVANSAFC